MKKWYKIFFPVLGVLILPALASAQSFRVQCPPTTITHPTAVNSTDGEPTYNGPTQYTVPGVTGSVTAANAASQSGFYTPTTGTVNGAIKCQQISGGDGFMTEADGTQTFMFSFGPLSGLADVAAGLPSTQFPDIFNTVNLGVTRGDPATTDGATSGANPGTLPIPSSSAAFSYNGAVGLALDIPQIVTVSDLVEGQVTAALYGNATVPGCPTTGASLNTVTAWTDAPPGFSLGAQITINNAIAEGGTATPAGYLNTTSGNPTSWTVSCVATGIAVSPLVAGTNFNGYAFQYVAIATGLAADTGNGLAATATSAPTLDGHVDPRPIMDVGVMNGNIPAPLSAFDEDDEFFLTLTNVGMIQRPDLFEQHTVHFHGYPNASSFYDGVPDASIAINIGASFTYYYLAPDAGTYFWHCHITPPEHLQMGMVGQLHVRPRQDRVPQGGSLYTYLEYQNGIIEPAGLVADLRTECNPGRDILCSATMPAGGAAANTAVRAVTGSLCNSPSTSVTSGLTPNYVYNDGDSSTCYDVEYPIQMHGFDPNFHFVGMTFNPEMFVDMKDKYFLLNGRSYPDTVGLCGGAVTSLCTPGPQATISTDGQMHYSQPLPALINIPVGGKALLRLVNLSVTESPQTAECDIP